MAMDPAARHVTSVAQRRFVVFILSVLQLSSFNCRYSRNVVVKGMAAIDANVLHVSAFILLMSRKGQFVDLRLPINCAQVIAQAIHPQQEPLPNQRSAPKVRQKAGDAYEDQACTSLLLQDSKTGMHTRWRARSIHLVHLSKVLTRIIP